MRQTTRAKRRVLASNIHLQVISKVTIALGAVSFLAVLAILIVLLARGEPASYSTVVFFVVLVSVIPVRPLPYTSQPRGRPDKRGNTFSRNTHHTTPLQVLDFHALPLTSLFPGNRHVQHCKWGSGTVGVRKCSRLPETAGPEPQQPHVCCHGLAGTRAMPVAARKPLKTLKPCSGRLT